MRPATVAPKIKINLKDRTREKSAERSTGEVNYRDRDIATKREETRGRSPIRRGEGLAGGDKYDKKNNTIDNEVVKNTEKSTKKQEVNGKANTEAKDEADEIYVSAEPNDEMMKLMGFGSFDTTKNKKVKGSNVYAAHRSKPTEYRQYMNREKGFNRPLSPPPAEKKKRRLENREERARENENSVKK
ncbi:unnamed protein product [Kuraishia capsulata CBS 1993]|uniref:U4/U6.U5 small nuclear ribonucleoprotein 27kDa protein domain-containing protein n=1 Tax=Kuraishia capsulata CBS 1993 TaxID=1382522 RepID=W6MQ70_9ASCO|nr:uncharacterized protein KUCA_T00004816001 [Kuraishia capsulata CBS 1993]CDK28831.1 unnamed protein product [Kuraishia capsulata CBS 1993]